MLPVQIILSLQILLYACGASPPSAVKYEDEGRETVSLGLEPSDFATLTEEEQRLARLIENQFKTSLNHIHPNPFRYRRMTSDGEAIRLRKIDLLNSGKITRDSKSQLDVDTGPGNSKLNVHYVFEQADYTVSFEFESEAGRVYVFDLPLKVNTRTELNLIGQIHINILSVLPESLSHLLTATFEDVFTASGTTENLIRIENFAAYTMFPLEGSRVSRFQADLVEVVLRPLCQSLARDGRLMGDSCDFSLTADVGTVKSILAEKIRHLESLVPAPKESSGGTGSAYPPLYFENPLWLSSQKLTSCHATGERSGLFWLKKHFQLSAVPVSENNDDWRDSSAGIAYMWQAGEFKQLQFIASRFDVIRNETSMSRGCHTNDHCLQLVGKSVPLDFGAFDRFCERINAAEIEVFVVPRSRHLDRVY